ncbi:MAG: GNAT family N-acetyltransferase [Armatimonadota bacterium]|nr:GNAT family N-acetyltransferase [Armatimonadota bacterium]
MELIATTEGPRCHRALYVEGKKVSWLTLIDYSQRIGGAVVRMGGIAGVGTEPSERMKGYSRRVIEDTIRFMQNEGYDVSWLFGIRDFYPKFGYAVCMAPTTLTIATRDAERAKDALGCFSVRPYAEGDLDALIELYNSANQSRTGTLVRERGRFSGISKGSRWSIDAHVIVVTGPEDSFVGYAAYDKNETEVIVTEVESLDLHAYPNLLYEFAKLAIERRTGSISILLPPDHPFAEFCHRYECTVTTNYARCGGGMGRIINLRSLFEKIAGELSRRLAVSEHRDADTCLWISTDIGEIALLLRNGEVRIVDECDRANSVQIPQPRLAQLVYGYRSARDMLTEPGVVFSGAALSILETLFPPQNPYVWAADHF